MRRVVLVKWSVAVALCAALASVSSSAFAQEEPHGTEVATPEASPGNEAVREEPAEGEGAEHHIEPINWVTFGGTRPDPAHAGQTKPNPPPFLAQVINFAILVGVLWYGVKKGVNPALEDRRKAIEAEIGEAQRLKAEAESMHREYSEKLTQLDAELRGIREEFQRSGKAEAERIVTEATARAERMQKEGQQLIEQELRQLRTDLHRQAVEAAVSSAESAVRGSIGPQDQSRLADEYLSNLEKVSREGGMAS